MTLLWTPSERTRLADLGRLLAKVTLRPAAPEDETRIRCLTDLDSAPPLDGPVILAEVDGELRCALSLESGRLAADPFRHTLELTQLLRLHCRAALSGQGWPRSAPPRA